MEQPLEDITKEIDVNSEEESNAEDTSNKGDSDAESINESDSDADNINEDSDVESIKDENELTDKETVKSSKKQTIESIVEEGLDNEDEDEDDDDEDDDDYLQKFNLQMRDDLILNFHPESKSHNYEEIKQLAKVSRNKNGIIVDELHKTIPILTKYEKTRILGQRAKQIECGGTALVQVPPNVIDSYLIAKLELEQNKIPFIIRRPLPNGGMEYWYVSDLENV